MQTKIAVFVGKSIYSLSRILKRGGGSAAPGLYALKLDSQLVEKLSSQIPVNIVITGTNGKTTTAKLLDHFAKANDLKVIRNSTGSNLERGIASTLISSNSLKKQDLGIWELDEAAFNSVVPKLKPQAIVFLNVFRDQLDRYGEVDNVVKKWVEVVKILPQTTQIFINGDDGNLLEIKSAFKGKVTTFGLTDNKILGEKQSAVPNKLEVKAEDIKLTGISASSFQLTVNHDQLTINLPLAGIYHIYDFLAAYLLARYLKISEDKILGSLKSFSPAFGRVEKINLKSGKEAFVFLIKNPTGATQVLKTIAPEIKLNDRILMALNDNFADGTDVSWIWDTEFEQLRTKNYELRTICSGTRAYDLALRLKYAGMNINSLYIEDSLKKAFAEAQKGLQGRLFILPTYTAMLELQHIFATEGLKEKYWETQ